MTYRVQASAQAEADIDRIFNCLFEGRKQGCNSYWDASPFRSPEMCMVSPELPEMCMVSPELLKQLQMSPSRRAEANRCLFRPGVVIEAEDHRAAKVPGGRYEYRDDKQRDSEGHPGPAAIWTPARLTQ